MWWVILVILINIFFEKGEVFMKNSRFFKYLRVLIVVLTLITVSSSTILAGNGKPPKKWHYPESALGCTADVWLTISDQNGDGVYDHGDIWAKYDTPLEGGGIWEKHGDFSFKDENGNGYINTDPSLDPGETDYINVMTFTPAYKYANPDGFRIEFRDITTDEVTGVFEQFPGEPMPLYTSYKDPATITGITSAYLNMENFTNIYPNPANEQIVINFTLNEGGKSWQDYFNTLTFDYLKIYNIEGKVVYEQNNISTKNQLIINTKSLPVGTYTVEVSLDGVKGSMLFQIMR